MSRSIPVPPTGRDIPATFLQHRFDFFSREETHRFGVIILPFGSCQSDRFFNPESICSHPPLFMDFQISHLPVADRDQALDCRIPIGKVEKK